MMEELRRETEELGRTKKEVEERIQRTVQAGIEIDEQAKKWLEEVHKIDTDLEKYWLADETTKSTWMNRLCCIKTQSKTSDEDVLKMKTRVNDVVDQGKSILGDFFPVDPIGIQLIWCEGFVDFKSRKSSFDKIMERLIDEEAGFIGIFGMGGIGKTTLVGEVGMEAKKKKLFDEVVIATVSQNTDIRDIQETFAATLKIGFGNKTETDDRANMLRAKMEKFNKILVILDDVWEKINMESIGVPLPSDHKGCKIIFTTRSEKVCEDMGCNLTVGLNVIERDEAWSLFSVCANLEKETNATKKIVRECAGLPLALITVGTALKNGSFEDYEDAAQRLCQSNRFANIESFDGLAIYRCLELSYDYLKDKDVQNCLLLCSSYPEDSKIMVEELIRYSYGLWLFEKVESVDEARQMIINSVETLEKASLLSQTKEIDPDPFLKKHYVKMHDVVRDVALWIAEKEYGPFIVVNSFKELKKKMSENAFAVSVTYPYNYNGESSREPEEVRFPETVKLVRLRLKSKKWPGKFFFTKPSALQVLDIDISYTRDDGVEVPDVTLELLVNLRTLRFPGEKYWR